MKYLMPVAAIVALAGCAEAQPDPAPVEPVCDRACLIGLAGNYVAGLESNSFEALPFAEDLRMVENRAAIAPGDGLWADITGPGTGFAIVVPDETNHAAGWMGMVERDGQPAMVSLRLQLNEDAEIVEAEHLWANIPPERIEQLQQPRPAFAREIATDRRKSHDELIAIGASYYDAVGASDGSPMPFAPDCQRHENGLVTAGPEAGPGPDPDGPPMPRDCRGQSGSELLRSITGIDNRRVFAADPVTGLVMGFAQFRHAMDASSSEVAASEGTGMLNEAGDQAAAAHIIRVGADGLVREIEAMGFRAPRNPSTGRESEDDKPSSGISSLR